MESDSTNYKFEDILFLKRGRGHVLELDRCDYYKQTTYGSGNSIWRCSKYKTKKCVGSITISLSEKKIIKIKQHSAENCKLTEDEKAVKVAFAACMAEAIRGEDTIPAIYKKTVASLEDDGIPFVTKIPTFDGIKSTMYRKRNQEAQVERLLSGDALEVEIPSQFSIFLLTVYKDFDKRIIMFCSEKAKQLIRDNSISNYFCDGTFEVCPKPFVQLYTIHGDLGSTEDFTNIVPLIYSLVTDKTKETYKSILELIKSEFPDWEPSTFVTDFEMAAIAAIKDVFPRAKHHGCYFHFTQALWKKAKKLNLTKDVSLKLIVGLCCTLPLLPSDRIEEGWAYIQSVTIVDDNLRTFITYMTNFWMKNEMRRSWSCFGLQHRTTNAVESWHHQFKGSLKKKPAQLLLFLIKLEQDAKFYNTQASKILNSQKSKNKRRMKIINRDRFIEDTQRQLIIGDISIELFMHKLLFLINN